MLEHELIVSLGQEPSVSYDAEGRDQKACKFALKVWNAQRAGVAGVSGRPPIVAPAISTHRLPFRSIPVHHQSLMNLVHASAGHCCKLRGQQNDDGSS